MSAEAGDCMSVATVVSVQIGRVRRLGRENSESSHDRPWETAFFKQPTLDPVVVGPLGFDGDEVADRKNHGGVDKAVLCYSADHVAAWRDELPGLETTPGAFGENLTVTGVDEWSVCIGDVWRVGDVRLEVSQPRQPCWKLGRRHRLSDLPKRVVANGRSGWYVRVKGEGVIAAGDALTLEDRPHPQWLVATVAELYYSKSADKARLGELARVAELAESWRVDFDQRANAG